MPYIVKSLAYSRRDQNGLRIRLSAASKKLILRMRIGGKRLPAGKSISISDVVYADNKSIIDQYVADGLISLEVINNDLGKAEELKVEPEKPKRRTRGKAKPKLKPKSVEPALEVAPPVVSAPPPVAPKVPEASAEKEAKESGLFRRLRKKSE